MLNLAQRLDDDLRVPKDIRAKVSEACRAEDLAETLDVIQTRHKEGDLEAAPWPLPMSF